MQDGNRFEWWKRQSPIRLRWNWHSYEAQAIGRGVCVELSTKVVYDQPAYRE